MRKSAYALVVVLFVGLFVPPGPANGVVLSPSADKERTAAALYGCINSTPVYLESGRRPLTSQDETGVAAYWAMPADHDFYHCAYDPFANDAALAWVGLAPGQGNSEFNSPSAILQIGIVDCDYINNTVCWGSGPKFFWARGGCNGQGPVLQDLGVADYEDHKYRVVIWANTVALYLDDVAVVQFDKTGSDSDWSAISCWATQTRDFAILTEKHDQGDNLGTYWGTYGITPGEFYDMKRRYDGAWAFLKGHNCEYENTLTPHRDYCGANGSYMAIWTSEN